MIDRQQQFHFAINTNDFALKLHSWDQSLPLCFATNKAHYARYGNYYLHQHQNLESTHPGATAEIEALTSVRRNTIGIGQAMDLTGEQTYSEW